MDRLNEQKLQVLLKAKKVGAVAVGDGTGLSFRITSSGASWQLRYRHAGKAHWLTLAKYPGCSLKEAQKKATKERARIGDGVDPVGEKKATKAALKAAGTFKDLATDFESVAFPDLATSTQEAYRRYLTKDILPRIGNLRPEEITGGVIVNMVEEIGKRTLAIARRCFTLTGLIFSHAQAKQLTQLNPCATLKLKAILGKKRRSRSGVSLTESQLRSILPRLSKIGAANAFAVRIILATAVRKSEMIQARWEHIDWEQAAWSIPSENVKTRKAIVIPLAPPVIEWFRGLESLAFGSPWVLPGQNHRNHISTFTLNVALARLGEDLPDFHVHDLRSTARSHLGALGVDVIVAEKCLNHSLGGLVDVYDRGDYFEERRKALELLADFLVRCEQPVDKVISLRKAG